MSFDNMIPLQKLDLVRMIRSLHAEKQKLLLWQKNELVENRCLYNNARFVLINSDRGELVLKPEGGGFNFLNSKLLYVFAKERNVVFKSIVKECGPDKLILKFPDIVMVKNLRKENRIDVLGQKIFLEFTHQFADSVSNLHRSEIIDMSPSGLCFKTPSFNDYGFQKGDPIWMRLKDDKNLMRGEIRHLTVVKSAHQENFIHIGVCF